MVVKWCAEIQSKRKQRAEAEAAEAKVAAGEARHITKREKITRGKAEDRWTSCGQGIPIVPCTTHPYLHPRCTHRIIFVERSLLTLVHTTLNFHREAPCTPVHTILVLHQAVCWTRGGGMVITELFT